MSSQRTISPPPSLKSERTPFVQLSACTPPPISESSCERHDSASRTSISSSPGKHSRTQGRNNLRLAWAKSSNFRNILTVPHGGSTHSVSSGDPFKFLNFIYLLLFLFHAFYLWKLHSKL